MSAKTGYKARLRWRLRRSAHQPRNRSREPPKNDTLIRKPNKQQRMTFSKKEREREETFSKDFESSSCYATTMVVWTSNDYRHMGRFFNDSKKMWMNLEKQTLKEQKWMQEQHLGVLMEILNNIACNKRQKTKKDEKTWNRWKEKSSTNSGNALRWPHGESDSC